MSPSESPRCRFAQWYARRGWPVIALHTPIDGKCSCHKGADCDSSGKHPQHHIKDLPHGVHSASCNQHILERWWTRWPTANVGLATGEKSYNSVPRFPSTYRDLALVVDADVSHQSILEIINGFSLVSEVKLFDVYSGKQVEAGKKSLAYRLTYQSPTHTLTDEEVNKVQTQILKRLTDELGATLRG